MNHLKKCETYSALTWLVEGYDGARKIRSLNNFLSRVSSHFHFCCSPCLCKVLSVIIATNNNVLLYSYSRLPLLMTISIFFFSFKDVRWTPMVRETLPFFPQILFLMCGLQPKHDFVFRKHCRIGFRKKNITVHVISFECFIVSVKSFVSHY